MCVALPKLVKILVLYVLHYIFLCIGAIYSIYLSIFKIPIRCSEEKLVFRAFYTVVFNIFKLICRLQCTGFMNPTTRIFGVNNYRYISYHTLWFLYSVVDLDPVGSVSFGRIRIRIVKWDNGSGMEKKRP